MQTKFSHIITTEDIASHPEVFVEGVEAGHEVLLAANDLAVLGITKHVTAESDIANNPEAGLTLGHEVDVPEAEAVSSLVIEKEAQDKKEAEEKGSSESAAGTPLGAGASTEPGADVNPQQ